MTDDMRFMGEALILAKSAAKVGEIPVGAVIVSGGEIISKAFNLKESENCALCHAEIEAIRHAGRKYFDGCTLYVTLEPCPMCAGAIINARFDRVVFGAYDDKGGACGSVCNVFEMPFNHRPVVKGGVREDECAELLRDFFEDKRKKEQ